ncbi:S66 family peptidase [Photobacterium ganghwense]|uniref:S66 family peptidase n=1 Tax=Photobacterium ganghwense TaxID=320778 RepID=UPI0039EEBDED
MTETNFIPRHTLYPRPLAAGSKIAVTAFSSGVEAECHPRLNKVLANLRAQGFDVIEGQCLRQNIKHASASKAQRAQELMRFLCDDSIDAVMPPWGGELAMDILPLLDYDRLRTVRPKWLVGFSDVSTVLTAMTTKLGWATVHTANLMEMHPDEGCAFVTSVIPYLKQEAGASLHQQSSTAYQIHGESFAVNPDTILKPCEQTYWKLLGKQRSAAFRGRLIGGCFDILHHLVGTEYLDLNALDRRFQGDGIILYLENAEMSPTDLYRALLSLKYRGVFSKVNAVIFGRNAFISDSMAADANQAMTSEEALLSALDDIDIPVVYDADIGHLPPNLTLFNGALAEVAVDNGRATVTQYLK